MMEKPWKLRPAKCLVLAARVVDRATPEKNLKG